MTTPDSRDSSAIRADDLQEIVVTADAKLRVVFWNRAGADITGFGSERTVGSDLGALFDEQSGGKVATLVAILRRGGTNPGVEMRLKTRYGHTVDVEVTGFAETPAPGGAEMTFIMRDMTLRSLLADRRDRLERMFRTLVEHAPSVIYITDASGRIEFTNSAVERILGYAPADLRGRQILDIVHPEDRERAYWPVHERRTGERATSGYKVRFLRRQGLASGLGLQGIVFSLSSVGLYFAPPQGEADPLFSGTEGIAEDITESESLREGLSAVLPICSACRKIRTPAEGGEAWVSLEEYVRGHANAVLSHGYCPECLRKIRDS